MHDHRQVNGLNIQELLDRVILAADERWPGASISDLDTLHGGVSSLTFAAQLTLAGGAGRQVVLKVAPPGLPPTLNRDVLRQARVLRALHGQPGVRVPEVLLEADGDPPLFVMEYVEGQAYEPHKDLSEAPPTPAVVDRRARAAARMLARLHELDPAALGLGSEPAIPLADELDRWARLFATAGDDLRHNETDLQARLASALPDPIAPRVVHGDYRIGNMQFDGDHLAAVIDWEIWSIGDPRTDLAWLLTYTDPVQRFVERRDEANQRAADAMPDRDQLLGEYLAVHEVDVADLRWFLALCYYKIASTTAVLAKRNRRRAVPDPSLEVAASTIPAVLERGLALATPAKSGSAW